MPAEEPTPKSHDIRIYVQHNGSIRLESSGGIIPSCYEVAHFSLESLRNLSDLESLRECVVGTTAVLILCSIKMGDTSLVLDKALLHHSISLSSTSRLIETGTEDEQLRIKFEGEIEAIHQDLRSILQARGEAFRRTMIEEYDGKVPREIETKRQLQERFTRDNNAVLLDALEQALL